MDDKLLTIKEVGLYLGVTKAKVYELINRPENPLPVIRTIGKGSVRISSEHLKAWLDGVFENSNLESEDAKGGE